MASFVLGPIYPPPTGLTTSDVVSSITTNLSDTLHHILQDGQSDFGDFNANTSSISITAVSTQDDEKSSFFDFHFSSPHLNITSGGTDKVTNTSMYRIGSISKLFTAYMLLVNFGWQYWDDRVTRFIPELRHAPQHAHNSFAHVDWNHVTVGSLASQLSGAGRDYANGDLASQGISGPEAGLPELPQEDVPRCAGNTSLPPCDRHDFFQGMAKRHAVFAPQTTPVYSNLAFRILGYVLEMLSGTQYGHLLESSVLEPLGMANTTAEIPSSKGSWVIPNGDSGWFQDMGDEMPTAGIYSSSFDLANFGRSILLSKQLSPLNTRRWMKPNSHTASVSFSVGSPWEIWRTQSRISYGRTIDLYTKSGSIGQYNSQLILLPDYGVTISVLVAGSSSGSVVNVATETVLQSLIPVLEKISVEEACKSLCGTYESSDSSRNSSIKISSDEGGILVKRWISRGVDVIEAIRAYAANTGSPPIACIRLQATNIQSTPYSKNQKMGPHWVSYRALFVTDSSDIAGPPRIMDPNGQHWGSMDSPTYGEIAVDDFVVHLDQTGIAIKIEPRVMRDGLRRVDKAAKLVPVNIIT